MYLLTCFFNNGFKAIVKIELIMNLNNVQFFAMTDYIH